LGDPNGNQLPPDRMTLALTAQEDKTSNATRKQDTRRMQNTKGEKLDEMLTESLLADRKGADGDGIMSEGTGSVA
jgi:hypothetical protein